MSVKLPLALIIALPQSRAVDPDAVELRAESISRVGLLNAINLKRSGEGYQVVTGLHGCEAARRLGWHVIDAVIFDADDVEARVAQIAENFHRLELTALQRAEHIDECRELKVRQVATPSLGGAAVIDLHRGGICC